MLRYTSIITLRITKYLSLQRRSITAVPVFILHRLLCHICPRLLYTLTQRHVIDLIISLITHHGLHTPSNLLLSAQGLFSYGADRSLFWNVSVWDPRHNTDHYMVLGCLRSGPEREYAKYLLGSKKLPLRPPAEPRRDDGIFTALRRFVLKPHARERRMNEWISEDTWRLVDKRVSTRRGTRVEARILRLRQAIEASLKGDRKRRVETVGEEVETLLGADPPNPKEAWRRLKGWYKAAVIRARPPARATLKRITAERVNLNSNVPSLGENIPVKVRPVKMDD